MTATASPASSASRIVDGDRPAYRVRIATADGGELPTGRGVRLLADLALDEVDGWLDTLLVAGAIDLADGAVEPVVDAQVTAWLWRAAPRARTGAWSGVKAAARERMRGVRGGGRAAPPFLWPDPRRPGDAVGSLRWRAR
ncbi:hypothetical protein AB0D97_20950 [Streptomyces roseus]|uniref:hypothetical protein n=1 Tax=Streptomyces roseus TaxID=66430 RepID=UPI00340D5297